MWPMATRLKIINLANCIVLLYLIFCVLIRIPTVKMKCHYIHVQCKACVHIQSILQTHRNRKATPWIQLLTVLATSGDHYKWSETSFKAIDFLRFCFTALQSWINVTHIPLEAAGRIDPVPLSASDIPSSVSPGLPQNSPLPHISAYEIAFVTS